MKKLMGISLIAALAVTPMMAMAAEGDTYSTTAAPYNSEMPINQQITVGLPAATNVLATTSYVMGAHADAVARAEILADNKVNMEYARATGVEGSLSNLTTTAKDNLVAAINEVAGTAGSAVQSVAEGSTNGTVSVNGADVAVHGLGSAAFTDSTAYDAAGAASTAEQNAKDYADSLAGDYATAAQGALAESAVQSVVEGSTNGTVSVDGTDVAVHGLGSAAYTASTAYDAAGAASTAEQNAKDYADGLASNYDAAGAADTAEQNAKDYADSLAVGYATAAQGALADTALQKADITTGTNNGTIAVDGADVAVKGLGTLAYKDMDKVGVEIAQQWNSASTTFLVLDDKPVQ